MHRWADLIGTTLARLLGATLGIIVALLILLESTQVIMRYFLSLGIPWARDVSTIGLMWVAWLGAPLLWIERSHIAVDFVPLPQGARWRLAGSLVLNLSIAIAAIILLFFVTQSIGDYAEIQLNGLDDVSASVKFYPLAVGAVLLLVAGVLGVVRRADSDD